MMTLCPVHLALTAWFELLLTTAQVMENAGVCGIARTITLNTLNQSWICM